MTANDKQVGGTHYKVGLGAIEHWDFCSITQADYLQGIASKYIVRWRKMPKEKGLQDLNKSKHILEKMLELKTKGWSRKTVVAFASGHAAYVNICFSNIDRVTAFLEANSITDSKDQIVFMGIFLWQDEDDLKTTIATLDDLINEASQ